MKIDEHQYADESMEPISVIEFGPWAGRNIVRFVNNISRAPTGTKTLHEWISWFLDWSEYSDFIEWKQSCEKDE